MRPRPWCVSFGHAVEQGPLDASADEHDIPIDELNRLATDLERLPDLADVDMAPMYLRHLRRRQAEPVPQPW